MKLTTQTSHEIKFSIEQFSGTEGGMDHDIFGDPVDSLPEAIHLLTVANKDLNPKLHDMYVIVCHVKTVNKSV